MNYLVKKSNRKCTLQGQDPVLNECAARLGVSLRQTEDTLTRDMLASTASFVNCVGGVNGKKNIAVLKSFLIDLETLTTEVVGDRAQA